MTSSIQFTIDYHRFIDASGKMVQSLPAEFMDPDLNRSLYRMMVLTRTFDEKAIKLQRTGKLGTYPSTLGQEAVSVGYGRAMEANDVLAPYYRDYGAQLQRGVTMADILRYWGGDERGNCYTHHSDDFPICVPIATQNLHAAGIAKAIQYRKESRVVVTTIGEGGTSEGNFYEAINLAGAWQLPLVFIVNNNQWAISVARHQQTGCQTIAQKAIAGGISGCQVDGNDVLAVYYATQQALKKARTGGGPSLIEAITYRLCDHTTADDASRYRGDDELAHAWQEEPIRRLKHWMVEQRWWDEEQEKVLQNECQASVADAVDEYLATPKAPVTDMFDYLYASLPDALIEQRETVQYYAETMHG